MTYGMACARNFDPYNPDHVRRDYKSFFSLSGEKVVPDVFSIILPKVRYLVSTISHSSQLIFMCLGYPGIRDEGIHALVFPTRGEYKRFFKPVFPHPML